VAADQNLLAYLLVNVDSNLTLLESGYYSVVFIAFIYFCTNPFIYAIKFEPVKSILMDLIPCKKTSVQSDNECSERGRAYNAHVPGTLLTEVNVQATKSETTSFYRL